MRMLSQGWGADKFTFLPVLSAAAALGSLADGKAVHSHVAAVGLPLDIAIATALLNMYAKCGRLGDARRVFVATAPRDRICWNAMLTAYARSGFSEEALQLFREMGLHGVRREKGIFLCLLGAATTTEHVQEIHASVPTAGLAFDTAVTTALLDAYAKLGAIGNAFSVFNTMLHRDTVTWTAMITACIQYGLLKDALQLFSRMLLHGMEPETGIFLALLNACTLPEDGKLIHAHITSSGLYELEITLQTALLNMYSKCSCLADARVLFDGMPEHDRISWNSIIAAYAQHGDIEEALKLCARMNSEGLTPDIACFLGLLNACVDRTSLASGKAIHELAAACGLDSDVAVGSALSNMYGKCGSPEDAQAAFDRTQMPDLISFNAVIGAYARNSCSGKEVFALFRQMQLEGVKPNAITFLCLLNACSHAGLLDQAWQFFISMSQDYGTAPSDEHFSCMVDILVRLGSLPEAEDMARNMTIDTDAVMCSTLLGALQNSDSVEAEQDECPTYYTPCILLSS